MHALEHFFYPLRSKHITNGNMVTCKSDQSRDNSPMPFGWGGKKSLPLNVNKLHLGFVTHQKCVLTCTCANNVVQSPSKALEFLMCERKRNPRGKKGVAKDRLQPKKNNKK